MPSEAWLAAAAKTDRKPVLLMSVESVDAIKRICTTKADWEAAKAATNINTATQPGDIFVATDGTEPYSGDYGQTDSVTSEIIGIDDGLGLNGPYYTSGFLSPNTHVKQITINGRWRYGALGSANITVLLQTSPDNVNWTTRDSLSDFPDDFFLSCEVTKGEYYVRLGIMKRVGYDGPWQYAVGLDVIYWNYETLYLASASLQTKNFDLGLVPAVDSIISMDDIVYPGTTITYTVRGSDDNAAWTDLGTVTDGDSIAPYRYYDVSIAMTTDYFYTPFVKEITISGGNSQFKLYGTHEDTPGPGVLPYLLANIGTLNSKLELMKLGSTGEVSPKLFYLPDTFALLRDNYLRNKAICLQHGFVGLNSVDYEPLFTGVWFDAAIDLYKSEISVKTRSIMSRFQKVKLPKEAAGARSETTCIPIEWQNENIIQVMLDIIDFIGLQDRYIDRASATTLISGARSGADWQVSRRLDKDNKEDAIKLLEELSVLSGVFLLQLPSGKLQFSLYDPDAEIVAEITSDITTFGNVEMGQAELFTRQQILYTLRHEGDLETGSARGAWASGNDYDKNDSVTSGGYTWYCLQNHSSAAGTEPGVGTNWRPYWAKEWLTGVSVAAGETVISGGPLYHCFSAHTSGATTEPGIGADWRTVWRTQPTKSGDSEEDFYNAWVLINQAAEVAWGLNKDVAEGDPDYQKNPGYQKTWKEKWNASQAAREALATRMEGWFTTPKMKLKASDLPPIFYKVQLGQFVGVTGLHLPAIGEVWGTPCSNKKFMVMSKTLNPQKCTVSFDLLEV